MKKPVLFLFLCSGLSALPLGNPGSPEYPEKGAFMPIDFPITFKASYESDWIYDRKLETRKERPSHQRRLPKFESVVQEGLLTLNIVDRIEIYSGAGAMSSCFSYKPLSNLRIDVDTSSGFAWQVGARALLLYWRDTIFGVDVKFFRSFSHADTIALNEVAISGFHPPFDYKEWQVGGSFAYKVDLFLPYIGITYADVRARLRQLSSINVAGYHPNKEIFIARQRLALVVGTAITSDRLFDLNVELSMIGESRATATFTLRL